MASTRTVEADVLWRLHEASPSRETEGNLVEHYKEIARRVAGRIGAAILWRVDYDHLEAEALIGLWKAVTNFDPAFKTKFKTYANIRVHGAIIDYLRDTDNLPRVARRRLRDIAEVVEKFRERGQRPTTDEIKQELGLSDIQYWNAQSWKGFSKMKSLNTKAGCDSENTDIHHSDLIPAKDFSRVEIDDMLDRVMAGMNPRELAVFNLNQLQGVTMKRIGEDTLGLSESRVSQIMKSAKKKALAIYNEEIA